MISIMPSEKRNGIKLWRWVEWKGFVFCYVKLSSVASCVGMEVTKEIILVRCLNIYA